MQPTAIAIYWTANYTTRAEQRLGSTLVKNGALRQHVRRRRRRRRPA